MRSALDLDLLAWRDRVQSAILDLSGGVRLVGCDLAEFTVMNDAIHRHVVVRLYIQSQIINEFFWLDLFHAGNAAPVNLGASPPIFAPPGTHSMFKPPFAGPSIDCRQSKPVLFPKFPVGRPQ